MPSPVPDPITFRDGVREAVLKYVDTQFWLRDDRLREERRELLNRPGFLMQDPLIEPVLPYDNTDEAYAACRSVGLRDAEADLLIDGLLSTGGAGGVRLRHHQAEALRVSLGTHTGRGNPVVTSGTGSGKTEAFLLPVIGRLLLEARDWPAPATPAYWWDASPLRWSPMRTGSRPAAVRALVLYPMNALVEDQIARLRRTLRRIRRAGGPDLWFGRYTGASPGGARMPDPSGKHSRLDDVAEEARQQVKDYDEISSVHGKLLAQMTDPRAAEMVCRWDMVSTPPDILVSNYSMLNVMLMRSMEEPLFHRTRDWLAQSTEHQFTVVVDGLHLYRGTQGAEVSMILRSLLDRLGLAPDSEQLRCIGTSASLEGSGAEFLERFFGIDRSTFVLLEGQTRSTRATLPVDPDAAGVRMDHAIVGGVS